ncbi:MAG: hypothetical protein GY811_01395 [Myxococcales bacterium]|nr:hypothetical protein [Myxococcales bacterium]
MLRISVSLPPIVLAVASVLSAGCGTSTGGDGEALIANYSPPGGGLVWICPDGTVLTLTSDVSKQSTLCTGIDGSECRGDGTPGPGDAECDDPSFNAFKGTCVEEFFSCFSPSGSCEIIDNGSQRWGDGALQDRDYPGFLYAHIAAGASEPRVAATLRNGSI